MDTPDRQQTGPSVMDRQLSDRGIGVLALVGCGILTYLSILSPLIAASHHQESVTLSLKGAVVTPVLLAIGLINVVMGDRAAAILGRRQKPSALGWVIYIATFGIGVLLYHWLKSRLRAYGYEV